MTHEIQHTAQQHNNNSAISEGYGMSQKHHFECPQATFDSDEHLAQFSRNISTITHLTAASSDRPTSYSICHKP